MREKRNIFENEKKVMKNTVDVFNVLNKNIWRIKIVSTFDAKQKNETKKCSSENLIKMHKATHMNPHNIYARTEKRERIMNF